MARKPDVQYIRFVTDGSAARVAQQERPAPKTRLPKLFKKQPDVTYVDPLAVCGILLSGLMLFLMIVSCVQLRDYQVKANAMDDYVDVLKEENARLSDLYADGYDLQDIQEKALALGLVPVENVQRITVSVERPQPEADTDSSWHLLTELLP